MREARTFAESTVAENSELSRRIFRQGRNAYRGELARSPARSSPDHVRSRQGNKDTNARSEPHEEINEGSDPQIEERNSVL